jgi:hypothetical protein
MRGAAGCLASAGWRFGAAAALDRANSLAVCGPGLLRDGQVCSSGPAPLGTGLVQTGHAASGWGVCSPEGQRAASRPGLCLSAVQLPAAERAIRLPCGRRAASGWAICRSWGSRLLRDQRSARFGSASCLGRAARFAWCSAVRQGRKATSSARNRHFFFNSGQQQAGHSPPASRPAAAEGVGSREPANLAVQAFQTDTSARSAR